MESAYSPRKSRIFAAAFMIMPEAERLTERKGKLFVEDRAGNALAEVGPDEEFIFPRNKKRVA